MGYAWILALLPPLCIQPASLSALPQFHSFKSLLYMWVLYKLLHASISWGMNEVSINQKNSKNVISHNYFLRGGELTLYWNQSPSPKETRVIHFPFTVRAWVSSSSSPQELTSCVKVGVLWATASSSHFPSSFPLFLHHVHHFSTSQEFSVNAESCRHSKGQH